MHIKINRKKRHLKKLFKSRYSQRLHLESSASGYLWREKYKDIHFKFNQFHNVFVYITTKNDEESFLISSALINLKLIACANILPAITSVFYWEDTVQKTQETVLIVKTTKDKLKQVYKVVKDLHSYTCPCIVAMPIISGNNDFLQWVHNATHP